jgi:hypothetical protein
MKIEREKKFSPITITLETKEELEELRDALGSLPEEQWEGIMSRIFAELSPML